MVRIMAEENLNWSSAPAIMVQTIQTTKEFLDKELVKYETLQSFFEICSGDFASSLFEDERGFRRAKAGVGRKTLIKFLGGNWTGHYVKIALNILTFNM